MTDTPTASVKELKPVTTKLYSKGRDLTADDKLAPQAKVIYEVLAAEGGDFTRQELITAITGKIDTKQAPGNVLNFYIKRLVDSGLVKFETVLKASLKTAA